MSDLIDLMYESPKKSAAYNEIMTNLIVLMLSKKSNYISFYGHILSFFSFKYIKNGKTRPDFDIGLDITPESMDIVINPKIFFAKSESEMMFRLIHEIEHILRLDFLFNIETSEYRHVIATVHSFVDDFGANIIYKKREPLAYIAMDLAVNSIKYIEDKYSPNGYRIGSDFLLKDGLFPLEKEFKDAKPYQNWEYYYDYISKLSEKREYGFSIEGINPLGGKIINIDYRYLNLSDSGLNNTWTKDSLTELEEENFKVIIHDMICSAKGKMPIPDRYNNLQIKQSEDWKEILKEYMDQNINEDE